MILIFLSLFPKSTDEGVLFTYYSPDANIVFISGDFNGWGRTPMEKDTLGNWYVILKLKPDRYEYKYIVDGEWVQDPDNPVRAGEYGNSVIIVDENGNVLIPYSSYLSFKGKNRMKLFYFNDSLLKMDIDSRLDILVMLSSVDAMARLRYKGNLYLQRSRSTYNLKDFEISGFYNINSLKSDDNFNMIGNEGKYRDSLGENMSGVFIKKGNNFIFYSNNNNDGSDIYGLRLKTDFSYFNIGFLSRIEDYLNMRTIVDSNRTYFLKEKNEGFGIDLGYRFISFEVLRMKRFNITYRLKEGNDYVDYKKIENYYTQDILSLKVKKYFEFLSEFEKLSFRDNEKISSLRMNMNWCFNNISINLNNIYFINKSRWEYLFYNSYISRISSKEIMNIGYRNIGSFSIVYKYSNRFLKISIDGTYSPVLFSQYYTFEFTPVIETKGKIGIGEDTRFIYYHYNFREYYISPFIYIFVKPFGNSYIRISYGLDPLDDEDRLRGREDFLESNGVNIDRYRIYNNFIDILRNAEKEMRNYGRIEIKAEVNFP
uniref:AMP-activated protein kinase glycogen-binding domain-containing protein n=1 Tax=candidate division WOR-3 bacterium TaxID=2052148 RepID=A0A7C4Y4J0_UNCW3